MTDAQLAALLTFYGLDVPADLGQCRHALLVFFGMQDY
jgi:hypothetical protein